MGLETSILSGLSLGSRRSGLIFWRLVGGSVCEGSAPKADEVGSTLAAVGVDPRLPFPDIPRSVANLYFLILALEIREVKWNTDTWGFGADMGAVS